MSICYRRWIKYDNVNIDSSSSMHDKFYFGLENATVTMIVRE